MSLKELFILMMEKRSYSLSSIDTSKKSIGDLIEYVSETYSDKVEYINILCLDELLLDELIDGNDISLQVTAVLSKINKAIPHLHLKTYV